MKAFIICPIQMDVKEVAQKLTELRGIGKKLIIDYWDPDDPVYKRSWIEEADFVVLVVDNEGQNHFTLGHFSPLIQKELERTLSFGKDLYVYRRNSFWSTEIGSKYWFSIVPQSCKALGEKYGPLVALEIDEIRRSKSDRRLLLLINR